MKKDRPRVERETGTPATAGRIFEQKGAKEAREVQCFASSASFCLESGGREDFEQKGGKEAKGVQCFAAFASVCLAMPGERPTGKF